MDFFEAYGLLASKINSPLLISGRSLFNENVGDIVEDVIKKLEITSESTLLEIGCNVGLLLSPLAGFAARAVGIDHEQCLEKYKQFGIPENVTLIAGRWPSVAISESFDCILVYAVMATLNNQDEALRFIDKCLDCLKPNGRLLIADIPNLDMAKRFRSSQIAEQTIKSYRELKLRHENAETEAQTLIFSLAQQSVSDSGQYLSDEFILGLLIDLRKRGYEAFALPQLRSLPYSYSREDILIWKR